MNETATPPEIATPGAAAATPETAAAHELKPQYVWAAFAVMGVLCIVSLVLVWQTQQRLHALEQELVRREQETQDRSSEAERLAKQAQEGAAQTAAKLAVLDARVAEVAVQRVQIEELIQSLSRSRDENLVVDIDAALRVAMQQSALTGSAEPLIATLKQADERLARHNQPRLEAVRRAIARDLDRVKAMGAIDIPALTIKLDEAVRMVDELPLLSQAEPRKDVPPPAAASAASVVQRGAAASEPAMPAWMKPLAEGWGVVAGRVWSEAKSLVRVTRIEHPEAMLLAPEQAYFLRENLKLRLLNARLALLARQFDTAQSDLQVAQTMLDRYFDRSSRRTQLAAELVRQVATQSRQIGLPRPENALAALSAAAAGR